MALLVVIVGTPSSRAEALAHCQHLWLYGAAMAVISGGIATLLRPQAIR